jgi:hypothetical protein
MAIADDVLALGSGITTLSGNAVLAGTSYDAAQVHAAAAGGYIDNVHTYAYRDKKAAPEIEISKTLDEIKAMMADLSTAIDKQQLVNTNTKDAIVLVKAAIETLAAG